MTRSILLILLVSSDAWAQVSPPSPRAAAMGAASIAVYDATFTDANPAASSSRAKILALRASQLFNLPELRFAEVIVTTKAPGGGAALGLSSFGFDQYRETIITAGYARDIRAGSARVIHAGARFRWYTLSIDGYGSASVPTLSVGLILPVIETFTLGMAATNVVAPSTDLPVERSITFGVALRPGNNVLLAIDAWKAAASPADLRIGFEMRPIESVALRGGFTVEPRRYAAGAGLRFSRFFVDLAAERHEVLGWSPSLATGFEW